MEIISHRGLWKKDHEKNSVKAFQRSFEKGFGTETDLRDLDGKIIISHDMPRSEESLLTFEDFLEIYKPYDSLTLALNIKADGLQEALIKILKKHPIKNYVLFDMSVPDLVQTSKTELKFISRLSEYEEEIPQLSRFSEGVWLDEFSESWIDSDLILRLSENYRRVFLVSDELHGRNHLKKWEFLKQFDLFTLKNIVMCTDLPEAAQDYFNE